MKGLRKILRVSWTAKKTNEWVLNKAGVKRELLDTDKARKLAYYGHTMRKPGSCLEKEIIFPRNPQNHVRWDTALPSHRLRPNRTSGSIDPPLPPPATTNIETPLGSKESPVTRHNPNKIAGSATVIHGIRNALSRTTEFCIIHNICLIGIIIFDRQTGNIVNKCAIVRTHGRHFVRVRTPVTDT